jgi:hypothetical protein
MEIALERSTLGLSLWILCLDDTRLVPKGARQLLHLAARSRSELESQILAQVARLLRNQKDEPSRGIERPGHL